MHPVHCFSQRPIKKRAALLAILHRHFHPSNSYLDLNSFCIAIHNDFLFVILAKGPCESSQSSGNLDSGSLIGIPAVGYDVAPPECGTGNALYFFPSASHPAHVLFEVVTHGLNTIPFISYITPHR